MRTILAGSLLVASFQASALDGWLFSPAIDYVAEKELRQREQLRDQEQETKTVPVPSAPKKTSVLSDSLWVTPQPKTKPEIRIAGSILFFRRGIDSAWLAFRKSGCPSILENSRLEASFDSMIPN